MTYHSVKLQANPGTGSNNTRHRFRFLFERYVVIREHWRYSQSGNYLLPVKNKWAHRVGWWSCCRQHVKVCLPSHRTLYPKNVVFVSTAKSHHLANRKCRKRRFVSRKCELFFPSDKHIGARHTAEQSHPLTLVSVHSRQTIAKPSCIAPPSGKSLLKKFYPPKKTKILANTAFFRMLARKRCIQSELATNIQMFLRK